ncbi:MAG TPA: YiiX family permuted papain-like enzyme [Planktothrix sp.]|jgi:uncharacterized protein YycO
MKRRSLIIFLTCIACCALVASFLPKAVSTDGLRQGDIIFQVSRSGQSTAIQLATHSKYSHVGMLMRQDNRWYVYEAERGVELTDLQEWIARDPQHHYVIKRLKQNDLLTPAAIAKLKNEGRKFLGRPYDPYFRWSDDEMYCSELVWKTYKNALGVEVGKLRKLKDFDLTSPTVKRQLALRYGDKVPLDSTVVSPADVFDSPILCLVKTE